MPVPRKCYYNDQNKKRRTCTRKNLSGALTNEGRCKVVSERCRVTEDQLKLHRQMSQASSSNMFVKQKTKSPVMQKKVESKSKSVSKSKSKSTVPALPLAPPSITSSRTGTKTNEKKGKAVAAASPVVDKTEIAKTINIEAYKLGSVDYPEENYLTSFYFPSNSKDSFRTLLKKDADDIKISGTFFTYIFEKNEEVRVDIDVDRPICEYKHLYGNPFLLYEAPKGSQVFYVSGQMLPIEPDMTLEDIGAYDDEDWVVGDYFRGKVSNIKPVDIHAPIKTLKLRDLLYVGPREDIPKM